MTPTIRRIAHLVYPLDGFYSSSGQVLPRVESVSGEEIPEPYRTLLVHDQDMTSTLEVWWKRSIRLRVLKVRQEPSRLSRQVTLLTEGDDQPVEFGAIEIHLEYFTDAARTEIIAGVRPLGALLRQYGVPYTSNPNAFFRITRDPWIRSVLSLGAGTMLFGRHNMLLAPGGGILAEVVEILPPMQWPDRTSRIANGKP